MIISYNTDDILLFIKNEYEMKLTCCGILDFWVFMLPTTIFLAKPVLQGHLQIIVSIYFIQYRCFEISKLALTFLSDVKLSTKML